MNRSTSNRNVTGTITVPVCYVTRYGVTIVTLLGVTGVTGEIATSQGGV